MGRDKLPEFENFLSRQVDGVVDFTARKTSGEMLSSARWAIDCWKNTGRKLSLSVPMLPDDLKTTISEGATGKYNANFASLGALLVQAGFNEATIRVGWDFNGNWYRWCSSTPAPIFREYFRQIVSAMRKVPGQRFQFVWNPGLGLDSNLAAYYPGDDVTDIIAADFYNQSWRPEDKDFAARWANYEKEPYGLNWLAAFAAERKSPSLFPSGGPGPGLMDTGLAMMALSSKRWPTGSLSIPFRFMAIGTIPRPTTIP